MLGTIVGLIAPLGGIGAFMYRKQSKRLKEAETRLAEVSVEKSKAEVMADNWTIWKEENERLHAANLSLTERNGDLVNANAEKEDRHQQDIKDWEVRFTNQTDRLREVQRNLLEANDRECKLTREVARLTIERNHYKEWRCIKPFSRCKIREPEQGIKYPRYTPLDGEDAEDNAVTVSYEAESKEIITEATTINSEINADN